MKIIHYDEIDSTQLEAWRKIEKHEIQSGTIIVADRQTKGKRNPWEKMVHRRKRKYSFFFGLRSRL